MDLCLFYCLCPSPPGKTALHMARNMCSTMEGSNFAAQSDLLVSPAAITASPQCHWEACHGKTCAAMNRVVLLPLRTGSLGLCGCCSVPDGYRAISMFVCVCNSGTVKSKTHCTHLRRLSPGLTQR